MEDLAVWSRKDGRLPIMLCNYLTKASYDGSNNVLLLGNSSDSGSDSPQWYKARLTSVGFWMGSGGLSTRVHCRIGSQPACCTSTESAGIQKRVGQWFFSPAQERHSMQWEKVQRQLQENLAAYKNVRHCIEKVYVIFIRLSFRHTLPLDFEAVWNLQTFKPLKYNKACTDYIMIADIWCLSVWNNFSPCYNFL